MTNLFLMEYIHKFIRFYQIEHDPSIDFENRELLLQKIKLVDGSAYLILNDFIEGELHLEFIKNNKKLKEENSTIWKIALLNAKDEAYSARLTLRSYSRTRNILKGNTVEKNQKLLISLER